MSMNELQKQTTTNIQEKANLIWEGATHLVGLFKPHEYGKVILPLTVLKRFDDALAPTIMRDLLVPIPNAVCGENPSVQSLAAVQAVNGLRLKTNRK